MPMRVLIGVVLALIVVGVTWYSAEEQQVPVTGRTQRVALSDEQQSQLGLQVFEQTLADASGSLVTSGRQFEQVRRVADRIAAVGAVDKPQFEWQVALMDRPEANAFCLPGGKIVVFTGLLEVARTDAQLAAVIGHEVAHAVAEHGAERIFRDQLTSTAVAAAAGAFSDDPGQYRRVAGLLGAGAQVGLSLPFSRSQETESDRIGLVYMARAGYDPEAAITFWQNMARAADGAAPPEYLSTHPSHATRVRQLRTWLAQARQETRQRDEVATQE